MPLPLNKKIKKVVRMNEIFNAVKDNLTLILAFLTLIAGIIDNSKKIAAKPLSGFFKWLGSRLNAEMSEKFDTMEAYFLNDFYQRHINGENLTREQYELAIQMFEKHVARGANSVNKLHLDVLMTYYKSHKWDI